MNFRLKSWDVFSRTAMCDGKRQFNGFTENFGKRIRLRRDLLGVPA